MTAFKLARLSLLRHRFATILTVTAIALSVACAGILLRLYELSESRYSTLGKGGEAIIGAKAGSIDILLGSLGGEGEYPGFLPYKLFESLRAEQTITHGDGAVTQPSYIASIIPFLYFAKFENYRVIGTDESFLQRPLSWDSLNFQDGHWFLKKGEAVVGSSVAKNRGLKVGDHIQAKAWIQGDSTTEQKLDFEVVGILLPTQGEWDQSLFASVEQAQEVVGQNLPAQSSQSIWGNQVLNYFLVYLKPGGFTPLESLVNKRTVGQVIQVEKQKERLQELTGTGRSIGLFITAFVILLGGLSVCSMLMTRFDGMSLQLAVLRAIGYTKKDISAWLLWEGFLLGLCGVILGSCIDLAGFPLIRTLLETALPSADLLPSSIINSWPVWVVALLATVLAVIAPLVKSLRQDTHNSLRGL